MTERSSIAPSGEQSETPDLTHFLEVERERLGLPIAIRDPSLEVIGELGMGGNGEVSLAVDGVLGRNVAVKTLHEDLRMRSDLLERVIREAQTAAQLEHPNIVPIYSLGFSPKHGVYFTMKRLRGDSLRHILSELAQNNPAYTTRYSTARRLAIFIRICQGILYAHSKQILHRDLKPENIRVGEYGEVTIIDWGLVHAVSNQLPDERRRQAEAARTSWENELEKGNIMNTSNPTLDGELNGTPRYMSPEQASAQNSNLDERSDIYSLGVILYELMTFFNPFYDKQEQKEIIKAVRTGNYYRPRRFSTARNVSEELEAICLKAMALRREDRYQNVSELLNDLYAHQEGKPVSAYKGNPFSKLKKLFQRNPIRTAVFFSALFSLVFFAGIRYVIDKQNVNSVIAQVEDSLDKVSQRQEYLATKRQEWNLADPEIIKRQQNIVNEIENQLEAANLLLNSISKLRSGGYRFRRTRELLLMNDMRFCTRYRRFPELKKRLAQVDEGPSTLGEGASLDFVELVRQSRHILGGSCTVYSVVTEPPDASLRIRPFNSEAPDSNPRLGEYKEILSADTIHVSEEEGEVNRTVAYTPVHGFKLPKGKYLFEFKTQDGQMLEMPVMLRHAEERNIHVVIPAAIPPGTVYVPENLVYIGDHSLDEDAYRRKHFTGFFIGKYEVTFEEYRRFWLSLSPEMREECMPVVILGERQRVPIRAFDAEGLLHPRLKAECPVVGVSHDAAQEYCKWHGEQIGFPCRLPTAYEWEAAARGVDARLYPWGNDFEKEFANTNETTHAPGHRANLPVPPGSFPRDISPYGAFDMAGNVRELTDSQFDDGTDFYQIKGASFTSSRRSLPLFNSGDSPFSPTDVGFRILVPLQ